MVAVTIVQHRGTDPNGTLAQILNAPILGERHRESFKIRCASLDSIAADIKGRRFVFNAQGLPTSGRVVGIVLYEDNAIAAQYIDCNFPVKRLAALILSATSLERNQVLPALSIHGVDLIFIR
ncbi:MAG: hypothetical protein AAF950_18040 [Pseudomonadota bacterium]